MKDLFVFFAKGTCKAERVKNLEDSTLLEFYGQELAHLRQPTKWKFRESYAQMALEMTTVVKTQFTGNEKEDSIVDFDFKTKGNDIGCECFPLVLFVAPYKEEFVVLGALISRTFHQLLVDEKCILYRHLQTREITSLFNNLELFDMPDYYKLQGCPVSAFDPECNMEQRLMETYFLFRTNVPLRKWDDYQPLVLQWMIFIVSGSDRVLDDFLNYECVLMRDRMLAFSDNPLLLFYIAQKWLRFDWRPKPLTTHRHSCEIEYPVELKRFYAHNREHVGNSLAMPSHSITMPATAIQWQIPGIQCLQCREYNCSRCPIERGYVTVPLLDIFFVAVQMTALELRKSALRCRQKFHTHEGFKLWPRLGLNASEEAIKAEIEATFQKMGGPPKRLHSEMAVRNSLESDIRGVDTLEVFTPRDPILIHRIVLPLWRELDNVKPEDLKPVTEHPLWNVTSKNVQITPTPKYHNDYNFRHISSREQLLSELAQAPCMAALINNCKGRTHLPNDKRTVLSNYICSRAKDRETAKQLYLWIWQETDRFKVKCNDNAELFWQDDIGTSFLWIWDNYSRFDYNCKKIISHDLCPFTGAQGDIEDMFKNASAKCTKHLNQKLVAAGKTPRSGNFRVYQPVKYGELLHN